MSDEREDETTTPQDEASTEEPGFVQGPTPSEEDLADPEIGGAAGGGPAGA